MSQEEKAVPFPFKATPGPTNWGVHLLKNEHRSFLLYDTQTNGDPSSTHPQTAIVTIRGCICTKFGYPNDEALAGHPLYARGLGYTGVFEVLNSSWITQLTQQNLKLFPKWKPWNARHWVFPFQDCTFECIAEQLECEISEEPIAAIYADIGRRLLPPHTAE